MRTCPKTGLVSIVPVYAYARVVTSINHHKRGVQHGIQGTSLRATGLRLIVSVPVEVAMRIEQPDQSPIAGVEKSAATHPARRNRSEFVRLAIVEKLERDKVGIVKNGTPGTREYPVLTLGVRRSGSTDTGAHPAYQLTGTTTGKGTHAPFHPELRRQWRQYWTDFEKSRAPWRERGYSYPPPPPFHHCPRNRPT